MSRYLPARALAAIVGVGTFLFLFVNESWRADNLFLVPDLVLTAALGVAAIMPDRWAKGALAASHGLAAGVLMTSVSSYAVRGEFGGASFLGAAACLAAVATLSVSRTRRESEPDAVPSRV